MISGMDCQSCRPSLASIREAWSQKIQPFYPLGIPKCELWTNLISRRDGSSLSSWGVNQGLGVVYCRSSQSIHQDPSKFVLTNVVFPSRIHSKSLYTIVSRTTVLPSTYWGLCRSDTMSHAVACSVVVDLFSWQAKSM